jgi:hypothetical protein
MAIIRICDICESRKTVKIIGFKLSNREDDYEELDICDGCELRMLRKFKHEIIENSTSNSKFTSYDYTKRLFEITKELDN